MEKTNSLVFITGVILVASIAGGVSSFYLAGGIPKLASDVGRDGAWGLSVFIQFLYALLSFIGFLFYLLAARKYSWLAPKVSSVAISAVVIVSCINLYGIYSSGTGIELGWFSLIIILLSAAVYGIAALIINGLTRHSMRRKMRAH